MASILLKNAQIINSEAVTEADIRICDSRIERIDRNIAANPADHVIDLGGKWVIPGGIDPHVHLALPTPAGPSADDFYTGSKAALAGGTTYLIDFVTPLKNQSLITALEHRLAEASNCLTGLSFHMGITSWNPDTAREMQLCVTEHGIRSFKAYLAYQESIGISTAALKHVMETAAALGAVVAIHCENGHQISLNQQALKAEGKLSPRYHALSRPVALEVEAIETVIRLCEITGCKTYIVHVSSGKGVDLIRNAQQKGLPVFAETCPHYLVFDEEVYELPDREMLPFIFSPPVRSRNDRDQLWEGIMDNTLSVFSTDHCPFNIYRQKDIGLQDFTQIPNGTGSIENRLSLLFTYGVLTKRITPNQWVSLISHQAACIFGMEDTKGSISEGKQADLVVWNPNHRRIVQASTQMQQCDHTIYEGRALHGWPEMVIHKGVIV